MVKGSVGNKYKMNCKVEGTGSHYLNIYSYNTLVAKIRNGKLYISEKYDKFSSTTSKHINHVANFYKVTDRQVVVESQFDALNTLATI